MSTNPDNVTDMALTRAQKRAVFLDEWENLDAKIIELSAKRLAARDRVLALSKHGQVVHTTSGRAIRVVDETVQVKSHAKVARELALQVGLSEAKLAKLYEQTASPRRVRDLKAA